MVFSDPPMAQANALSYLVAGKPLIRLGNVSKPTITVYKPAADKADAAGEDEAPVTDPVDASAPATDAPAAETAAPPVRPAESRP